MEVILENKNGGFVFEEDLKTVWSFLSTYRETPLVLVYAKRKRCAFILNTESKYSILHVHIDECYMLANICSLIVFHTTKAWKPDVHGPQISKYMQSFDAYYKAFRGRLEFINMPFMCDSFMVDLDNSADNISLLKANQYLGDKYIVPAFVSCCKRGCLAVFKVVDPYNKVHGASKSWGDTRADWSQKTGWSLRRENVTLSAHVVADSIESGCVKNLKCVTKKSVFFEAVDFAGDVKFSLFYRGPSNYFRGFELLGLNASYSIDLSESDFKRQYSEKYLEYLRKRGYHNP